MQSKEIIYSILVSLTIASVLFCFILYILFQYKKSHNKFVEKLETINENYQNELLSTQLEIQEQTFIHIGQELHDNVGHVISLATLSISKLLQIDNKEVKENAQLTLKLLQMSLEQIRHISTNLNAEFIINTGLIKSIDCELGQLEKFGNFTTLLNVTGKSCCIDEEKEIVLFRIVQEAINNIIKHSKASIVKISIHFGDKNLYLSIYDNGIGFSVEEKLRGCYLNNSSGLQNIIRRCLIIHASYEMLSSLETGTSIIIKTPYQ